jgi:hypothetical protein
MSRIRSKFVWTGSLLLVFSISASAAEQSWSRGTAATCDVRDIAEASYALTTRVQASIVTADRTDEWWERFSVREAAADLADLNWSSIGAAERARSIDSRNLMAHALLARQYVVTGEDATLADAAWQTVLDSGGAVVWTATLYDVDTKSYFLMAFDRSALRVYRYGELAGPFKTHMGMPTFVGPDRERFWRAMGGCIDPAAQPEAIVLWDDVREIKTGNWVLYFKLRRPVTIASDRGKRKTLNEIKVNLHGAIGTLETHVTRDTRDPRRTERRTMGIGPLDYQQRVRYTLVKFVDPDRRIALPRATRSAGW